MLAGSSTLVGVLIVAATSAPAMAQLVGHFGFNYQESAWIVGLVAAGSLIVSVFFPMLAPVLGTLRLIIFFVGMGAAIGW
jgi:hypothetical protein